MVGLRKAVALQFWGTVSAGLLEKIFIRVRLGVLPSGNRS